MEQMTSGIKSLWGRLIEPHSAVTDSDKQAHVRVLAAFMLGLFILTVVAASVYFLIFGVVDTEFWLGIILFLLIYILSRSPLPRLGDFAVVIGITAIVILLLINRGGETHNLVWVLVPILLVHPLSRTQLPELVCA
jgi:hypothetical protein